MPRIEFAPSLVSSLFQIVDPRAVKSSKEQLQWLKRNVPKLAFSHRPAMFNQAFIESAEQAQWLGPARPLRRHSPCLAIRCSERVRLSGAIHSPAGRVAADGVSMVVGLHPDEATEIIVDFAVAHCKCEWPPRSGGAPSAQLALRGRWRRCHAHMALLAGPSPSFLAASSAANSLIGSCQMAQR